MGTSSVATDAVRNIINRAALERGNANAQWWSDQLLAALGGPEAFTRVALRQMSGGARASVHMAPCRVSAKAEEVRMAGSGSGCRADGREWQWRHDAQRMAWCIRRQRV